MKFTAACRFLFVVSGLASWATGQTAEQQIEHAFHSGQQALQQGQFTQAVAEFKKVLVLDPTVVEAEVNLGLAYQSLLQYDLAVLHLTKGLRARPNLPGPALIVGLDYLKLGAPQKGMPFLDRVLKLDPANMSAREALAAAHLNQQDFKAAADQYKQMAALDKDKSEAWFNLGHQYLELAARLAYRGAHLYPESSWGHRFLGDLLFQRSRWEEAIKEYEKALSVDLRQPGLHTSMGQGYLRLKKPSKAEQEFRLDLQLDSQNELAWLGLTSVQLAKGQTNEALDSLEHVWKLSPEFLELPIEFPSVEIAPEQASVLVASLPDTRTAAVKHFLLATLYGLTKERAHADKEWAFFQKAAEAAKTGSAQDPCHQHRFALCATTLQSRKNATNAERLTLGKVYFTLQQYEAAADSLGDVKGVNKENAEASYWLSRSYQALATEAYARLQDSFGQSWRAAVMRAESASLRGSRAEALKEFSAALEANPAEPELHERAGEFYIKQDEDRTVAQGELEKALALDPQRAHSLYLLGYLLVEEKENEKALPYLQRALRLQPDLTEINSLLGTAYLRLDQPAEAIPLLEKATAADHYGNVHYQLSLAYRKLGKAELAKKELAVSQQIRHSYLERDEALIMGTSPQPKE